MKKILIIHTFGMGDMIMALPMLNQVYHDFPNAKIDLFYTNSAAKFPITNPHFINKIFYSNYEIRNLFKIIQSLRRKRYDVSIVTSISFASKPIKLAFFSYLVGAKERVGEYLKKEIPILYTKQNKFERSLHRVKVNMNLWSLVTKKKYYLKEIKISLNLSQEAELFAEDFIEKNNLIDFRKMVVHVGTSSKGKHRRWENEKFINLIKRIKADHPKNKIIIAAGPDELKESERIARKTNSLIVKNEPLENIAAIIKKADFFLNSDSGLGHIASAFDTEIFTIFGPGDERKTAPYSNKVHIIKKNLSCQPCLYPEKDCNIKCLKQLSVMEVYEKINEFIKFD